MKGRALALCSLAIVLRATTASAQSTPSYQELQRFSDVLNHIRANYADSVTTRQLVHSAIDGMLRSLDPHSWFLSTEDNARFNALERGELAVIGVSVELADGIPTILAVTDRSPADRAGVRPADRVLSIDGIPTAGLNARAISLRLAGDKGSRVEVLLERGPRLDPDSVTVMVKREIAKPEHYVRAALMLDATTGYIRLGEFGLKSGEEVHDAVRKLKGQKASRLMLDLRGNPGGIVTEAVAMASEFLSANSLVFSTRGRQKSVNQEYRTKGDGDFRDLPMVVLVDQGSASAAEALAGSLQDNDRAVVAGRRTFGKALMQTAFMVPDGMVELTIGHVIAPSGRYIQRPYSGLQLEQYYAFAGDSAWQDTTRTFKTLHGRTVKAGGGIAPDVALPPPPTVPRWYTVAADSGWDRAVADSVANTIGTDPVARKAWSRNAGEWSDRLLPPLLSRVRTRLAVPAQLDARTRSAMAVRIASEVAAVRWGDEAGRELSVINDPDVIAAIALFPRVPEILHH
jgi:carboxyl-terminal processing protease